MNFKEELSEIYKKSTLEKEKVLDRMAEPEMDKRRESFKRELISAAENGEERCVFKSGTAILNRTYHLLAKEFGLKSRDSLIYTEGDNDSFEYRDVIVSGWK